MRVIRLHYVKIVQRLVLLIITSAFLYTFCLRSKRYSESFDSAVHITDPKLVWEFIGDFSNQQRLNPAIVDFEVEYERGNYDNWEYGVTYHELCLAFPVFQYDSRAEIKMLVAKGGTAKVSQPHRILTTSTHCAFGICQETSSEMTFKRSGSNMVRVHETVHFGCPIVFSFYCHRQIRAEKKVFFENLEGSTELMALY